MKGLLLVAGRGSRMGDLTDSQPKCYTHVAGKRLFDWQVEAMQRGGVEEFGLITGYLREAFPPHYPQFYNAHWASSNMVRSLTMADTWLKAGPCIVSYGDIFYESRAVEALAASTADIGVLYDVNWRTQWEARFKNPLEDAESFRLNLNGTLMEIGNRALSIDEIQGQYMGLLRFTPAGWERIEHYLASLEPEAIDTLSMTALLQQLINTGVSVHAIAYDGMWGEVDHPEDIEVHEARLGKTHA